MKPQKKNLAIAFLFFLLAGAVTVGGAEKSEDEKLVEGMNAEIREVQQKMLSSTDYNEQAKLQGQVIQIMEKAMAKMSESGRAVMLVGIKVTQPIQQESTAYIQMVADFSNSPAASFVNIRSRDEIKARLETLGRLDAANTKLLARLDNAKADAERELGKSKISDQEKRGFMEGFDGSFGRRIGPLRAIRSLDTKLYARWREALVHLDDQWGNWSIDASNQLDWKDAKAKEKFLAIMNEIQALAERQGQAQQELANRT